MTSSSTKISIPEYLHVVGYFSTDVPRPGELISDIIASIKTVLGASFRLKNPSLNITRHDVSLRNPQRWTRGSDLQNTVVWYDIPEIDTDAEESLRDDGVFEDNIKLGIASLTYGQEAMQGFDFFSIGCQVVIEGEENFINSQHDAYCLTSIRVDCFDQDDIKRVSARLSDDIIKKLIHHGKLYYALQDGVSCLTDCAGWCYQFAGPSNYSSLQFRIEHELWEQAGIARREKVRGVFPGQYLSPFHLEKIGGKERLIKDLQRIRPNRLDYYLTDLGEKGVILRLATTPIDATRRGLNMGFSQTGVWAYKMFRDAGLLL